MDPYSPRLKTGRDFNEVMRLAREIRIIGFDVKISIEDNMICLKITKSLNMP